MVEIAVNNSFRPPLFFRNPHMQSVLASIKLRRPFVLFRARRLISQSSHCILDCGKGVRLEGKYTARKKGGNDLAVLIHGWEGSADSVYLISAADYLFRKGFDVFRLNLRDHGNSHRLNRGLFHSCRIDETVGAVKAVQKRFPHRRLFLAGFSLGGNFALRIAARAPAAGIRPAKVMAVSPLLDPQKTMQILEGGPSFYHHYFMKKWRRSLQKKYRLFPEFTELRDLSRFPTLGSMTEFFAPRHTGFSTAEAYLRAYSICGNALENLQIPSRILASADDPIIPAADLPRLASGRNLTIELTSYGGHTGFIRNFRFRSYAEECMARFFLS
ncbi:MAG: alpha/beta fold hydrolase [Desulfococcaceae bacterium]|nr:alpha/beta fold hydrolase [Desulfococcaceae bacterium]